MPSRPHVETHAPRVPLLDERVLAPVLLRQQERLPVAVCHVRDADAAGRALDPVAARGVERERQPLHAQRAARPAATRCGVVQESLVPPDLDRLAGGERGAVLRVPPRGDAAEEGGGARALREEEAEVEDRWLQGGGVVVTGGGL